MQINLRSTTREFNPNIPLDIDNPRCSHRGCKNPKSVVSTNKLGLPYYRKLCAKHHTEHMCSKHGVSSMLTLTAARQDLTPTEYQNKNHIYRKHRKSYCENIDGHLGYVCDSTIRLSGQLQVDRVDGCPTNNNIENLKTYCMMCHYVKTHQNKDYASPGRKTLKRGATQSVVK